MALLLNNLGTFSTIEQVWAEHPEGGREGDYVVIGSSTYYWDKYSRCWVQSSATPSGGGGSRVVDGDLTVTGDLGVGGDAVINGRLIVNGVEVNPNAGSGVTPDGTVQLAFKSIVFKRSDGRPQSPTDGSFGNPIPNGWYDSVPQGTDPIWMSSRYFTSDNQRPAGVNNDNWNVWSTPALMSDTEDFDVEFSNAATSSVPSAPPENESDRAAAGWYDPVRDPGANWSQMKWMATRNKYLNDSGVPTWTAWKIMLIKGEDGAAGSDGANGDGVQSVYAKSATRPTVTSQGYPPTGSVTWYKDVNQISLSSGEALWMSERRCNSGTWSAWSRPVRISGFNGADGQNGSAGEDGADIEFIYKRSNSLPSASDTAPESVNTDGHVPDDWENHPSGVGTDATTSVFYKYEWMCQRIKPAGNDEAWGPWVGPFVWSAYGDKGMDGDGIEYIYRRIKTNQSLSAVIANPCYTYKKPHPTNPNLQESVIIDNYRGGVYAENNVWYPEGWDDHNGTWTFLGWSGGEYDNGEWIPQGWSDNPKGVNSEWVKEYMSIRKRHNGVWGDWCAPALWAMYSEEHTIEIIDGEWWVDGQNTHIRAEGQNGTGVEIKGTADYLTETQKSGNAAGITGHTLKSLEGITNDANINKTIGDCYVVDFVDVSNSSSANWVRGHIYVFNGSTSTTWSDKWTDLGQFRGEAGTSQYMHIAWATGVTKSNGAVTAVIDFETDYEDLDPVKDYSWMGICVDNNVGDDNNPLHYDWNYIKGVDGRDVEFVYIRTKTNVAPGWTNNYTDSNSHTADHPEFLPCVNDNYSGEAEVKSGVNRSEYTDNPQGVSSTWPYEWMLKRVKSNGVWGSWNNGGNAVLWSVWSTSRPWVKTEVSQIVIDANEEGKISPAKTINLKCWLYYGEERVSPTQYSATYGGNSIDLGMQGINPSNPFITVPITVPANTALTTQNVVVTMGNGTYSASETVPVIINRAGASGLAGATLRFRGEWDVDTTYTYNSIVRDCVKHNNSYWVLSREYNNTTTMPGNGDLWTNIGNLNFVATELLLAENGAIDLLSSNVINLFDASGFKTASINADGNGSYCIYYSSGNKMMEFRWDGYIVYYNDDGINSVRWKIGKGGQVQQGDSWEAINLNYFGTSIDDLPTNFNGRTDWSDDLNPYYKFSAGAESQQTEHDGEIRIAMNFSSVSRIPDGVYSPNAVAVSDNLLWKIRLYKIVDCKIVQEGWYWSDGNTNIDFD